MSRKLTFQEQSIQFRKIHGDKYQYDESTYINNSTKMRIICLIHGEFFQAPGIHKLGVGCKQCGYIKCGKSQSLSYNEQLKIFKEIHGNRYEYDESTYISSHKKMRIICPIHGEFWQTPNNHKDGHGCPRCNESRGERKIYNFLKENKINFESQKRFNDCRYKNQLIFDFYLPELNICIEFDGEQHYYISHFDKSKDDFHKRKLRDKIKNNYCFVQKIKLIRIPYWDFDNIEEILSKYLQV